MSCEILDRIRDRLTSHPPRQAFAPASEDMLAEEEASLGFGIPPLLRQLCTEIANGGFGPGYGIIGVGGGHASDLGTLARACHEIQRGAAYLGLPWKTGVLPFCGWGDNIFSCVDCNDMHYPVIQSEGCRTRVQDYTLDDFFSMWLDGADILNIGNPPKRKTTIVNPFTRKNTSVIGARLPKAPGEG
ncbi:MAG: SMI1/KNR4 family protein [Planctomycetes bacterium]|nr:SMI1/KNR4 family protein [Planctomycetota bacterium]